MALEYKLLIGVNGSGKTYYVKNKIIEPLVANKKKSKDEEVLIYSSNSEINFDNEIKKDYGSLIQDLIRYISDSELVIDFNSEKVKNLISSSHDQIFDISPLKKVKKITDELLKDSDYILAKDNLLKENYKLSFLNFDLGKRENDASGLSNYSCIILLSKILLNIDDTKINLSKIHLFIDEPEKFAHPNLLIKIANALGDISTKINVYMTSHSPKLVNLFFNNKKRPLILYFNDVYDKINDSVSQMKEIHIDKTNFEGKNNFNKNLTKNSIFREEVIANWFYKKIIVCEDNSTKIFLQFLMDKNKIYDNMGFFIVHGKEHIEQAHDFLVNVMKINQDLIYTVFDKDDENDSKHRDWNNGIINKYSADKCYSFDTCLEDELGIKKELYKYFSSKLIDKLYSEDFAINDYSDLVEFIKKIGGIE